MSTKRVRTLFLLLAGIPLLAAALGASQNSGVTPPDATYRGLTYGEWAAEWWRAVFAAPVEGGVHPLITGGAVEGDGRHGLPGEARCSLQDLPPLSSR